MKLGQFYLAMVVLPFAAGALLPHPQQKTWIFATSSCLEASDDGSATVSLGYDFPFGGCVYRYAQVSTNGHVYLHSSSFYQNWNPQIMPFSGDLVSTTSTTVCYSIHNEDDSYVENIKSLLRSVNELEIVEIEKALVVTYYQITGYRYSGSTTFQLVLFTDGEKTGFFFLYDEKNPNWAASARGVTVGFRYELSLDPYNRYNQSMGYSQNYVNFGNTSNVGIRGVYYYRAHDFRGDGVNPANLTCTLLPEGSFEARTDNEPIAAQPLADCDYLIENLKNKNKQASCSCKTPYKPVRGLCRGAKPDSVMFLPKANVKRCATSTFTNSTAVYVEVSLNSFKAGGLMVDKMSIFSDGRIVLFQESTNGPFGILPTNMSGFALADNAILIAPYLANLRFYPNVSTVCYALLETTLLTRATTLVRSYTDDDTFNATFVVVVTFDKMGDADSSSAYNASSTPHAVTAQLVLIAGGGDVSRTYANLNYEFLDYRTVQPLVDSVSNEKQSGAYPEWPSAVFDFPPTRGRSGSRTRTVPISLNVTVPLVRDATSSVVNAFAFDQLVGNTGILGSWLFRIDGPTVVDPVVRRSNDSAPRSAKLHISVPSPKTVVTVSPFVTSPANATNVTCRSPYVAIGSKCVGANPDVVMFPYVANRTCIRKQACYLSELIHVGSIKFGSQTYAYVQVGAQGFVSLATQRDENVCWKNISALNPENALIVPYGGDLNFYHDVSNVCYQVYNKVDGPQPAVERAGALVRNFTDDSTFTAKLVIVVTYEQMGFGNAHWDPASGPREAVTAQAVIISGGDEAPRTYVNFNYEFADYVRYQPIADTESETLDYSDYVNWQQAGFASPSSIGDYHARDAKITKWTTLALAQAKNSSVINANAFDQLVGNTGVLGSWLFRVDGAAVVDPVVRRTTNAAPQSFDDVNVVLKKEEDAQISASPLAVCNITGNCTCRSPYVGNGSVCLGAEKAVVMFPYKLASRTCIPKTSRYLSASASIRKVMFGGKVYNNLQIAAYGYLVLGDTVNLAQFNNSRWSTWSRNLPIIAPYAGDLDFSDDSNVCYTVNYPGQGYQPIIERANKLVRSYTGDASFSAQSVIVVTYEKMVRTSYKYWSSSIKPSEAVTAQAVIISAGESANLTYVNFNYEFSDYVNNQPLSDQANSTADFTAGWEQTFEFPSYTSNSVRHVQLTSSNRSRSAKSSVINANAFDQLVGNTGLLGSWLYRVDGASVVDPVVRKASNAAPQSVDELSISVVSKTDSVQSTKNVSPLAVCQQVEAANSSSETTTRCTCRSPYVGDGTTCRGANPELIMFPYKLPTQICPKFRGGGVSASAYLEFIRLGGASYSYFQVTSHGVVAFSSASNAGSRENLPWSEMQLLNATFIAPYGGDLVLYSKVSNICYSVHTRGIGYQPIIDRAEKLVRTYADVPSFTARTVVVVTFEKMGRRDQTRRDSAAGPLEAVTAQAVIISGGMDATQTYVNFNYEFTDYVSYQPLADTVSSTMDYSDYPSWEQAVFKFPGNSDSPSVHYAPINKWLTMPLVRSGNASIVNANAFDQLVGNTGLLGSWLFRADAHSVSDPVVRRAKDAAPQSLEQLQFYSIA